ncbi:DUF5954 family protein [Streptomyces acidiscabies]|uniref:DUF5954 family protein n=1 Tax=Streptomyces acidiscabies TaxID=42234 RepID=A0AAP6B9C0_9ACTN|nr:DUF5954 family protein [Streptomyces acidiscabies]MBP5936981.1 hypothetical protein [Streptomyces sp. LBUM 1476]MBZ3914981.1 hypothetical protein [Streptomyces acidiscabies]MDX2960569.1 DUF5954 family protein [Streptomyces acidiscabies]MDX3024009.1 DUF5954 family protein [Streptomyces acidiscabies]MDX3793761.1 DUF5954 family protein [Streptomyces acidiscabies]
MTDDWKRHIDELHAELVRRDDPVAWVREADAVEASRRYPLLALRGPVFGVAVREGEGRWRVKTALVDGMPQMARDELHSHLWFAAKDDTDDPAERRALIAAVSVLEKEPANEVEALGVRYRIVRGDEFARSGEYGLEPPRPTDPEPADLDWDALDGPSPDVGFVLDPTRDEGPMASALRLGLREFSYVGTRFAADAQDDSRRAVTTHPDLVRLPVGFAIVERDEKGWTACSSPKATPHEARRWLYQAMTRYWPLMHRDDDALRAEYAAGAEEFRSAGRADEATVAGRHFRVCRVERVVRMGPDGPETPRPSDVDQYGPSKMHPTLLEDGTVIHED